MSWNYRIVRKQYNGEDYFAIHEVYYDKDGKEDAMTKEPVTFVADFKDELIKSLEMALSCAKEKPVFDPPEDWLD